MEVRSTLASKLLHSGAERSSVWPIPYEIEAYIHVSPPQLAEDFERLGRAFSSFDPSDIHQPYGRFEVFLSCGFGPFEYLFTGETGIEERMDIWRLPPPFSIDRHLRPVKSPPEPPALKSVT